MLNTRYKVGDEVAVEGQTGFIMEVVPAYSISGIVGLRQEESLTMVKQKCIHITHDGHREVYKYAYCPKCGEKL
jgi:hypothetical protein